MSDWPEHENLPSENENGSEGPTDKENNESHLQERLRHLEEDNAQLRERLSTVHPELANPNFDPLAFRIAYRRLFLRVVVPLIVILHIVFIAGFGLLMGSMENYEPAMIGSIPIVDLGGMGTSHPGVGFGLIAFGGFAFGLIAMGGGAVGIIALGGGAVGLFACGGGSLGLIACGGGSIGYIAFGGSAVGRYALGERAFGKAAFGMNRQDPEAVAFFGRFFAPLKSAITRQKDS
jgi:hypothetical protein